MLLKSDEAAGDAAMTWQGELFCVVNHQSVLVVVGLWVAVVGGLWRWFGCWSRRSAVEVPLIYVGGSKSAWICGLMQWSSRWWWVYRCDWLRRCWWQGHRCWWLSLMMNSDTWFRWLFAGGEDEQCFPLFFFNQNSRTSFAQWTGNNFFFRSNRI